MKHTEWNKTKRLEFSKVQKMLQRHLKGKLELSTGEYDILLKVALSLQKEQEEKEAYVPLAPPPLPATIKLKAPKDHKPIKKDPNMNQCIQEMLSNKLFLKRRQLCEQELVISFSQIEVELHNPLISHNLTF